MNLLQKLIENKRIFFSFIFVSHLYFLF